MTAVWTPLTVSTTQHLHIVIWILWLGSRRWCRWMMRSLSWRGVLSTERWVLSVIVVRSLPLPFLLPTLHDRNWRPTSICTWSRSATRETLIWSNTWNLDLFSRGFIHEACVGDVLSRLDTQQGWTGTKVTIITRHHIITQGHPAHPRSSSSRKRDYFGLFFFKKAIYALLPHKPPSLRIPSTK